MIKVTGPRGVLTKSFKHMSVDMFIDANDSSLIRVNSEVLVLLPFASDLEYHP